jgi:protein MpaA
MERLNQNINGYRGEIIEIQKVLNDIEKAAEKNHWQIENFYQNGDFKFLALKRSGKKEGKNVYLSAGIHGDEPAGPLAARRLLSENQWDPNLNLWFCPTLNPLGFTLNTRENERGVDLNRDYKNPKTPEVIAHIKWLNKQPQFDLSLDLHEDWESSGFYILEPQDQESVGRLIIKEVSKNFPINTNSTIEGFPANNGVVSPKLNFEDRPEWPEAFYLVKNKSRDDGHHYTFEAASDYSLEARVEALKTAVRTAIDKFSGR